MRRTLLLCVVLFVGCAKSEPPASQSTTTPEPAPAPAPAAVSLADVAGTWDGSVMLTSDDTVRATIELTATADSAGWSMKLANAKTPKKVTVVPAKSVMASGDSVMIDAGPFASVLRPGQKVSTHTVYHLQDGKLMGTIMATYPASGQMVELRTEATRKTTP